jgi:hypothetical protein
VREVFLRIVEKNSEDVEDLFRRNSVKGAGEKWTYIVEKEGNGD